MLRRLYFLFPDEKHAKQAFDQLAERNIAEHLMYARAQDCNLTAPLLDWR